jgi:hypothetical protein
MDDATKQALFKTLGSMEAKLESIEQNNVAQWQKMEKLDNRVRNQEIKSGGISALVAIGISFITKSMNGGG